MLIALGRYILSTNSRSEKGSIFDPVQEGLHPLTTITLRVPKPMYNALRDLAGREGRLSPHIAEAIRIYLRDLNLL